MSTCAVVQSTGAVVMNQTDMFLSLWELTGLVGHTDLTQGNHKHMLTPHTRKALASVRGSIPGGGRDHTVKEGFSEKVTDLKLGLEGPE